MVYDFLPDSLLTKVENIADFLGMLAFDQWIGNADSRQAIFFRARLKEWLPAGEAHPDRLGFVAHMVDHGYAFEGPQWRLKDAPLHGLYHRPLLMPDVPKRLGETIKLMPNAPKGLSALYVNRGLGTVGAPVRLGAPPEITHVVLRRV